MKTQALQVLADPVRLRLVEALRSGEQPVGDLVDGAGIAQSGVSFDREEASVGVSCVAAPVFGPDGTVVAAMSVTGRIGRNRPDRLAPAVMAAARGTTRSLIGMRAPVLGARRLSARA